MGLRCVSANTSLTWIWQALCAAPRLDSRGGASAAPHFRGLPNPLAATVQIAQTDAAYTDRAITIDVETEIPAGDTVQFILDVAACFENQGRGEKRNSS